MHNKLIIVYIGSDRRIEVDNKIAPPGRDTSSVGFSYAGSLKDLRRFQESLREVLVGTGYQPTVDILLRSFPSGSCHC